MTFPPSSCSGPADAAAAASRYGRPVPGDDKGRDPYQSFGAYLRSQRQLAQLTLRQLAELSSISNPYLSQIERGLHQPSVAVIRSIADALNLSADALLAQVAGLEGTEAAGPSMTTEAAIRADAGLSSVQKSALLSVYRTMVGQPDDAETRGPTAIGDRSPGARASGDEKTGPALAGAAGVADASPAPRSRRPRSPRVPPAKSATTTRRRAAGRATPAPGPADDPGHQPK
jgi:transcriptional regulator with XRE-family HTH domain